MTTINLTFSVDEVPAVAHLRWVAGQDLSIALTVTNTDGTVYDLSNCTAVCGLENPDNPADTYALTTSIATSTGIITCSLTDTQTAAVGVVKRLWHITITGAVNRELVRGVAVAEGRWG